MRIIRLAILIGVAALILPLGGFLQRASTVAREVEQRWMQLTRPTPGAEPAAIQDFRDSDVNIRAATSTSSDVLGTGRIGDGVRVDHTSRGQTVTCADGRSTAEWLHITDRRSQVAGFVSRCYL